MPQHSTIVPQFAESVSLASQIQNQQRLCHFEDVSDNPSCNERRFWQKSRWSELGYSFQTPRRLTTGLPELHRTLHLIHSSQNFLTLDPSKLSKAQTPLGVRTKLLPRRQRQLISNPPFTPRPPDSELCTRKRRREGCLNYNANSTETQVYTNLSVLGILATDSCPVTMARRRSLLNQCRQTHP